MVTRHTRCARATHRTPPTSSYPHPLHGPLEGEKPPSRLGAVPPLPCATVWVGGGISFFFALRKKKLPFQLVGRPLCFTFATTTSAHSRAHHSSPNPEGHKSVTRARYPPCGACLPLAHLAAAPLLTHTPPTHTHTNPVMSPPVPKAYNGCRSPGVGNARRFHGDVGCCFSPQPTERRCCSPPRCARTFAR